MKEVAVMSVAFSIVDSENMLDFIDELIILGYRVVINYSESQVIISW